jgi:hypothetical protein
MDGRRLSHGRGQAQGDEARVQEEFNRLRGKASEMQHPGKVLRERAMPADFYSGAAAAINRHLQKAD